jgi:hypothetical protein
MPHYSSKAEWLAEGRRLLSIGTSVDDLKKQIGTYTDSGGQLHAVQRKKEGIIGRNMTNVKARNKRRDGWEAIPESLKELFSSPEAFEEYQLSVKQGKAEITRKTRQAGENGTEYNKGHITSAKDGGPSTERNYRLENKRNNASHGASSPPVEAARNAGYSTTWKEDAINFQDPSGLPTEYTPKDKLEILNAPPDKIDQVTADVDRRRWEAIKKNPDARPIRTNPNPNRRSTLRPGNVPSGVMTSTPPVRPKPSRKAVKALAAAGIAAPSIVGTGVSAAETHQRAQLAIDTKNPMDFVQAGLSGLSFLADFIPGVGELISTPADIANLTIDGHREPKTVQSQVSKLHAIKLNR